MKEDIAKLARSYARQMMYSGMFPMEFNANIPEPSIDITELMTMMRINLNILIDTQIEIFSRIKMGMSKQEMDDIKKEVFNKNGIPLNED